MSPKDPVSSGKDSPVMDEKEQASIEMKGGSSQDERSSALGYSTPALTPRPRLPYRWQLAVIILTCLCTCGYLF